MANGKIHQLFLACAILAVLAASLVAQAGMDVTAKINGEYAAGMNILFAKAIELKCGWLLGRYSGLVAELDITPMANNTVPPFPMAWCIYRETALAVIWSGRAHSIQDAGDQVCRVLRAPENKGKL